VSARLGQEVEAGEELARLYLRREDEALVRRCAECFTVAEAGAEPELILGRV
jgi:thymidine phosphorylase